MSPSIHEAFPEINERGRNRADDRRIASGAGPRWRGASAGVPVASSTRSFDSTVPNPGYTHQMRPDRPGCPGAGLNPREPYETLALMGKSIGYG